MKVLRVLLMKSRTIAQVGFDGAHWFVLMEEFLFWRLFHSPCLYPNKRSSSMSLKDYNLFIIIISWGIEKHLKNIASWKTIHLFERYIIDYLMFIFNFYTWS
jgi:hypothetical protein